VVTDRHHRRRGDRGACLVDIKEEKIAGEGFQTLSYKKFHSTKPSTMSTMIDMYSKAFSTGSGWVISTPALRSKLIG